MKTADEYLNESLDSYCRDFPAVRIAGEVLKVEPDLMKTLGLVDGQEITLETLDKIISLAKADFSHHLAEQELQNKMGIR